MTVWGLFSAIAAGLLAIGAQIAGAERHPRAFKQLAALVDMWQKMPTGSDAESTMARIVNQRAIDIENRILTRPPLNTTNVTLTILLSGGLGYGAYWLWVWAASGAGWTVGAWISFVVALLLTLLFIGGGIGTFRNPPSASSKQ